jgi:hypothetical protein
MENYNQKTSSIKHIYLMPYAHCDYAWTNTRQWHLWRYVEGFRQVLDIMKKDANFTFLVDNVSQTGKILVEYLPERMDEVRLYAAQGRICVVNGGMELLRPSQNGGELFVRNMVMGKTRLSQLFGIRDIPVFLNADTAVGHSQMPQLLKLCGHKAYRFMRPNGALDHNGVPLNFIWKGLDGSAIFVSRGIYVGMSGNYMTGEFSVQKDGFLEKEVNPRLKIQPVEDLLIFVGGDDSLPMKTVFDVPIDLKNIIKTWNEREESQISYSTINDYFEIIAKQNLPVVKGVLDPCELSYCVPSKSIQSLWRRSYEYERLLIAAEKIIVIAKKAGCKVDHETTEALWESLAGISEHALDSLLSSDYEKKLLLAESLRFKIDELINSTAEKIASLIQKSGEAQYILFNLHPWTITDTFILHLCTPWHIKPFKIIDSGGKELVYQIVEQYWGDKPYPAVCNEVDSAIRLSVKPFGWESIHLVFDNTIPVSSWNQKPSTTPEILDNGILKIIQSKGLITRVEDKEGRVLFDENNVFAAPRFYASAPNDDWYAVLEPQGKEEFKPRSVRVLNWGELVSRIEAEGCLGGKSVSIIYTLKKDEKDIGIDFYFEGSEEEGTYSLAFSCDEKPNIKAGIPFGVENRDLAKEAYGSQLASPEEPYLIAERSMRGLYWARHFTSFSKAGCSFALLQGNGYVFYRHDTVNHIVEAILMHSFDRNKKTVSWVKKMHESCFGQGRQAFSLSVVYAHDMDSSDLHKLALQREQPFIKVPRFHTAEGLLPPSRSFLELEGMPVTAVYQEEKDLIIRGFEADGRTGLIKISGEEIKNAESCDLCLNTLAIEPNPENIRLSPWEIKTVKLQGFFDE